MKKIFLLLIACGLLSLTTFSQVGIGTTTPDGSAMLDVSATNKGILIPRMTSAQRTAIVSPARGVMVFDTDNGGFWFYTGTTWSQLATGNNSWSLTGNSGTNPATNFIGTTDLVPLRFRVNNLWAGEINPSNGNSLLGISAGNSSYTGTFNSSFGNFTLQNITTGSYNAAFGTFALSHNTTGNNNTATGTGALSNNSTANNNTAIGANSLFGNSTGFANVAAGAYSLTANTTGFDNTGIGYNALGTNTTGNFNTATGFGSLAINNSDNNTANGYQALYSNTAGSDNTANGYHSLYNNSIGVANTANGRESLNSNTNGSNNTALGWRALFDNTSGGSNTGVGINSLAHNTSGGGNVGIGNAVLANNTTGNFNTAIGWDALSYLNGGSNNIAIGYNSGTDPGSPGVTNTISIGNDGFLNAASNQVFIGNFSTAYCGTHVSWSTFSDARIKTNIKEEVKGLDFIMRLKPVTYHKSIKAMIALTGSKETKDYPGKYDVEKITFSGFLAQDVEKAAIASGYNFSGLHKPANSKDLYALSYETFVVPLVKAMQEQQKIIDDQKNEINEMKLRLKTIEDKLKLL